VQDPHGNRVSRSVKLGIRTPQATRYSSSQPRQRIAASSLDGQQGRTGHAIRGPGDTDRIAPQNHPPACPPRLESSRPPKEILPECPPHILTAARRRCCRIHASFSRAKAIPVGLFQDGFGMVRVTRPSSCDYPPAICAAPRRAAQDSGFRWVSGRTGSGIQGFGSRWGGVAFDSAYLIWQLGLKSSITQQPLSKRSSMPNENWGTKAPVPHNGPNGFLDLNKDRSSAHYSGEGRGRLTPNPA